MFKFIVNDCMRSGKLSTHLIAMHPKHYNKKFDIFLKKKASGRSRKVVFFHKHSYLNNTLLEASFKIALLVAKAKNILLLEKTWYYLQQ